LFCRAVVSDVGALGVVNGVTELEVLNPVPVPALLVALTLNV